MKLTVVVNGEPRRLPQGSTLLDLLAEAGRDPRSVAVEHNGAILRRDAFAGTVLGDGDRVEIVHFVQGG